MEGGGGGLYDLARGRRRLFEIAFFRTLQGFIFFLGFDRPGMKGEKRMLRSVGYMRGDQRVGMRARKIKSPCY